MALSVVALLLWVYVAPLPSAATPAGAVMRYYTLEAKGRRLEARGLLAPEVRDWELAVPFLPGDEFGLYKLRTEAPFPDGPDESQGHGYTRSYRDIVTVPVYFTQRFGDGVTEAAGGQFREVLVGRRTASSPWVILEFGFGG